jgi:hypothetical protein
MEFHRGDERLADPWPESGFVEGSEATRMSEKGGPVIMVALLCVLFWLCSEPQKDPTQCDLPDSSALIETMREASKTLESSKVPEDDFGNMPNHIVDANKKVDPMPSPSDKHEATKREILVFLAPKDQKCEPCDRWKRCEMQRFMDAKWEVAIFDEPHSYGRTPTFELKSGDKKATLTGYTTLEQAAEALR